MEVNRRTVSLIAIMLVVFALVGFSIIRLVLALRGTRTGTIVGIIGGVTALISMLSSLVTSVITSRTTKAKITLGDKSREIVIAQDVAKEVRAVDLIQKLKEMGYELHPPEVSNEPEKQQ